VHWAFKTQGQATLCAKLDTYGPNVSTTPLWQWGFRQCLPFSWTTLRGKHCRNPIAVMGVVDTFGHGMCQIEAKSIRFITQVNFRTSLDLNRQDMSQNRQVQLQQLCPLSLSKLNVLFFLNVTNG
jgi:hypothetical protein